MTSEGTLPGENDSPPGSVRAEESSQRKHSETRMPECDPERVGGQMLAESAIRLAACREPGEEIWSEHADRELSG